jgi:hypothetical protein
MNKKEYPLWLKIAMRFPLRWKHWLRGTLQMAEFWSTLLVVSEDVKLCELIENTDTPDFEEFDRRLNEVRKAWGKHDSHIESYAVRGRLMRFKWKHKMPNKEISRKEPDKEKTK